MSVFEDLKAMKEAYKDLLPFDGVLKISAEQYNAWVSDNRTVKKRLKDRIKFIKKMIKCQKKK